MQTLNHQEPSARLWIIGSVISLIWIIALAYFNYSSQIHYTRSTLYTYSTSDERWIKTLSQPLAIKSLRGLISVLSKVMRQHSVEYWIDEGTLLGVYRQQDIIPWDNDVDISIMAINAPRLFHINKSIPEDYYLEIWESADKGEEGMLQLSNEKWRSDPNNRFDENTEVEAIIPVKLESKNTRDILIVGRLYDRKTGLHLDIFQYFL